MYGDEAEGKRLSESKKRRERGRGKKESKLAPKADRRKTSGRDVVQVRGAGEVEACKR